MINFFSRKDIGNYIYRNAKKNGIDPVLFSALIYQESRGDIYAYKIERGWEARLQSFSRDKLKDYGFVPSIIPSLDDEKRFRSISFGLTQVLGQTAREQGFKKQYLSELFKPRLNIDWGLKIYISKRKAAIRKIKTFDDSKVTVQTLLFYNGGGDKDYPQKVTAHIENGNYQRILNLK